MKQEAFRPGISALGTDRVGLLAIRNPTAAAIVLLALTVAALIATVLGLRFNGGFEHVLKSKSGEFQKFVKFEKDFRTFSQDEVLLVRGSSLNDTTGFEALRSLHLDLQLASAVQRVMSIFSLVKPGTDGNWQPALPPEIETKQALDDHLGKLLRSNPVARSLFAPEHSAALIVLAPKAVGGESASFSAEGMREISHAIAPYREQGLEIQAIGKPAIENELVSTIKREQVLLAAVGILICAIVALWVFGTLAAAVVCTLPTLAALSWYLGFIAASGQDIDLLTTVIPVLIIVLTFADTLHLYFHWRRLCDTGQEPLAALERATRIVAPACGLAAVTTAIAFLALSVAASDALDRMAFAGAFGVVVVYFSVITVGPLAATMLVKSGARFKPANNGILGAAASLGRGLLTSYRRVTVGAALIIAGVLIVMHFNAPIHFKLTDFLPRNSKLVPANKAADAAFNGAGQMFATVRREAALNTVSPDELERLRVAEKVLRGIFGPNSTMSLATAQGTSSNATTTNLVRMDFSQLPASAKPFLARFISKDHQQLLISIFVSQGLSADNLQAKIQLAKERLSKILPSNQIDFTGGPALRSVVIPNIISDLRHGLLLSVAASIFVIGLALKSWRLGLAALLPNALPVLAAEVGAWGVQGGLEMPVVIALTVGFGLAVDDSVHLLNHYVIAKAKLGQDGVVDPVRAMREALQEVSPALLATTIVLCTALTVTALSSIATVLDFGAVVIAILVLALLADILILPSMAVQLERKELPE